MKKIKYIIFSIIVILALSIFIPSYNRGNELYNSFTNDISDLIKIINLSQNQDYGYHEFVISDNAKSDIYTTYYALEINKICEKKEKIDILNILENYKKNQNDFFFNEDKFDNLSNIYFFTKIAQLDNININNKSIEKYVLNLQCNNGSFAFSKKHKNMINTSKNKELDNSNLLSTYMALYVLNYYNNIKFDHDKLSKWIEDIFYNTQFTDISKSSYLLILIRICNLTNIDISIYCPNIDILIHNYNKQFNNYLKNNLLNIIILDDLVNLNKETNYNSLNEIDIIKVERLLNILQKKDGWFSLDEASDTNILPTYIALNFKQYFKLNISNKDKILLKLDRFNIKNKGYVFITDLNSNLQSTYFAQQIYYLFGQDNINIKNYLNNFHDISNFSVMERYYYYNMLIDSNKLNAEIIKADYHSIGYLINNEINNISQLNNIDDYLDLYYNLLFLKKINYVIDNNLKTNISNLLYFSSINIDELQNDKIITLKYALDILIFDLIEINQEDYKNNIENFNCELKKCLYNEKDFDVILTYFYIHATNISGINYSKGKILQILKKCSNEDGTFRQNITKDSSSSFISTYYALLILDELNIL